MTIFERTSTRCAIVALIICSARLSSAWADSANIAPGSEALPEQFRYLPIDRLSSGALWRLNVAGSLVQAPATRTSRAQTDSPGTSGDADAAVTLDLRVGSNIRLGDDPPALPSNQRAQAEPHIARAPNDPDLLLATFQEGRYTNGAAIDCGYSTSHDGGLTWSRALIPGLTPASGGSYPRATDPVAGIAADGTAYLNTLGVNGNFGAVFVSRSTDGGNTFAAPKTVYASPNSSVFPDKNWMAVNTFSPNAGRLVATFTLFSNTAGVRPSPIMRSLSDDGGQTWTTPAYIHPANYETQGSQPVFLPNNRLAIIYTNFNFTDTTTDDFLECVLSTDGGLSFGAPKYVMNFTAYAPPGIRSGTFISAATTDATTGNLYVVIQGVPNSISPPRVIFTKSTDGGNTWSAPIGITDNPAATSVFNPAIAASPDGQTLTVSYYTNRDNPTTSTSVDLYLAQSFDGGVTWQPNIRVSSVSTDAKLAPNTGTAANPRYMLGDYLGIAGPATPDVPAVPVWIDTRTGNPDPFIARVGIAPAVNFTSWQAARLSLGQINNPQLGGQGGDADHDREDNLSEYRSGTDPQDPLSVLRTGRQLNISTRARVQTGDNILIGGFIITGSEPMKVIARAIGPSLSGDEVVGPLQDPTLELFDQSGVSLGSNDNWKDSQQSEIEATALQPTDDRESAIVRTLVPGSYTGVVRGNQDDTGVALVEVYDLTPAANSRLANISSRSFVGTGEDVMIGGFIVGAGQGSNGAGSERVVVRGIGPSLASANITDPLQDPELILADANGATLAQNDNWREAQQAELQATGLAPSDDREAAVVLALPGGNYTAIVRGKGGTTGVGAVEAYNVQ
jgi:hypothetical protein